MHPFATYFIIFEYFQTMAVTNHVTLKLADFSALPIEGISKINC
jgi:hypothetical protein